LALLKVGKKRGRWGGRVAEHGKAYSPQGVGPSWSNSFAKSGGGAHEAKWEGETRMQGIRHVKGKTKTRQP